MNRPLQVFLLLLVLSTVHCLEDRGYMRAIVEKNWTILAENSNVDSLSFEGYFLMNNSYQHVLSIETNGQPVSEGELVKIAYSTTNLSNNTVIYARAVVETHYPPAIDGDYPFQPGPGLGTPEDSETLAYSEQMRSVALSLARPTELETIAAATDWTFRFIEYNISYVGTNPNATDVFHLRQGVCTEYARIESSLLRSIGIRSRVISGYTLANKTVQPHAWLEVFLANGSVLVDPTYAEAGALSPDHIPVAFSEDLAYPDTVNFTYFPRSNSTNSLEVLLMYFNFSIEPLEYTAFQPAATISHGYDNSTSKLAITVSNPTAKPLLFTYHFISPESAFGKDMRILSVAPGSSSTFNYTLNKSKMLDNYIYIVPFIAKVPGTELNSAVEVVYNTTLNETPSPSAGCAGSGAALALILLFAAGKNAKPV